MIAFWNLMLSRWGHDAPRRPAAPSGRQGRKSFPGALMIVWALGVLAIFVLFGLPTPGAAQTYACPAAATAAGALCGNGRVFRGCLIDIGATTCASGHGDIDRTGQAPPSRHANAGLRSEWP